MILLYVVLVIVVLIITVPIIYSSIAEYIEIRKIKQTVILKGLYHLF